VTKPLRLDREAEEELETAWRWYEERRPGLGTEFLTRSRKRSSSSIVFVDLPNERRVVAIAHGRREPGFGRERLRPTE
jgi:plasmid stabilization system protein ParE